MAALALLAIVILRKVISSTYSKYNIQSGVQDDIVIGRVTLVLAPGPDWKKYMLCRICLA